MLDDPDFELFKMFNGGVPHPLIVGRLPTSVQYKLGWLTRHVYITPWTAQKIRWHDGNECGFTPWTALRAVIEYGDIAQDIDRGERDIVFMLQMRGYLKHLYAACRIDRNQRGIFVRTLHPRFVSHGKIRRMKFLLARSQQSEWAA